jgi:Xaa-Pro aminopeptidase
MERVMAELMAQCDTVHVNTNEHYRASIETETREDRYTKWLFNKYPAHSVAKSNPILQRLRSVKDPIELDLIQKACDISEKGLRRVLGFIELGVTEYEIEAEFMHEFLSNRSKGFAYWTS